MSGQLPPREIASRLRLGFGLRLGSRVGAIFLGSNCPRTCGATDALTDIYELLLLFGIIVYRQNNC